MIVSLFTTLTIIEFFTELGSVSFGSIWISLVQNTSVMNLLNLPTTSYYSKAKENLMKKWTFFKYYKFLRGNYVSKTFQIFGFFPHLQFSCEMVCLCVCVSLVLSKRILEIEGLASQFLQLSSSYISIYSKSGSPLMFQLFRS